MEGEKEFLTNTKRRVCEGGISNKTKHDYVFFFLIGFIGVRLMRDDSSSGAAH